MARSTTDRDRTRRDKQHLAEPTTHGPADPRHHGRRFAETEARLRARAHPAEAPQREASDRMSDDHLGSTDAQMSPTPSHASSGAVASETGQNHRGPAPVPERAAPAADALLTFGSDALDAFRRFGQASRAVALLPVRAAGLVFRLAVRALPGSPGRA